jgi:hypothetical protein
MVADVGCNNHAILSPHNWNRVGQGYPLSVTEVGAMFEDKAGELRRPGNGDGLCRSCWRNPARARLRLVEKVPLDRFSLGMVAQPIGQVVGGLEFVLSHRRSAEFEQFAISFGHIGAVASE